MYKHTHIHIAPPGARAPREAPTLKRKAPKYIYIYIYTHIHMYDSNYHTNHIYIYMYIHIRNINVLHI